MLLQQLIKKMAIVESTFTNFVSNVGFPIAITIYLLFRFEKIINKNTHAINKNTKGLDKLQAHLKRK